MSYSDLLFCILDCVLQLFLCYVYKLIFLLNKYKHYIVLQSVIKLLCFYWVTVLCVCISYLAR